MGAKSSREEKRLIKELTEGVSNSSEQVNYLRKCQELYLDSDKARCDELEEEVEDLEERINFFRQISSDINNRYEQTYTEGVTSKKDMERIKKMVTQEFGDIGRKVMTIPTRIKLELNPVRRNLDEDVLKLKGDVEDSVEAHNKLSTYTLEREREMLSLTGRFKSLIENENNLKCTCSHIRGSCRYSNSSTTVNHDNRALASNGNGFSIQITSRTHPGISDTPGWRTRLRTFLRFA